MLLGAYARGTLRRTLMEQQSEGAETLVKLIRIG